MYRTEITPKEFKLFDPEVAEIMDHELERQTNTISLIPSENFSSPLSKALEGCILSDKNAEGYPNRRVVAGCENADAIEELAIKRLKKIFNCDHANVQPMSSTIGNVALLNAVLETGDTILSMNLNDGGHLSHGASFHISSKGYNIKNYTVCQHSEYIDMDEVKRIAQKYKPKLIICGASSYPRLIDYVVFSEIAQSVGAFLWADIAHVSGLIAGKCIPSPIPHADFVTTSTHKTWRGPRGSGVIMCRKKFAKQIDRSVFPGLQGAPKMDMIAARAVFFKECMTPKFKEYTMAVLRNAQILAGCLKENGLRLVSGGTDTHLILADVSSFGLTGKEAERLLSSVGLVSNRNPIPFDRLPASVGSGLRLGSPSITTRGFDAHECNELGKLVTETLKNSSSTKRLDEIASRVFDLAKNKPLFCKNWMPVNA